MSDEEQTVEESQQIVSSEMEEVNLDESKSQEALLQKVDEMDNQENSSSVVSGSEDQKASLPALNESENQEASVKVVDLSDEPAPLQAYSPELTPIYAGDLVCYRGDKPYEWTTWFGRVLSPQDPLVKSLIVTSSGTQLKSGTTDDVNPIGSQYDDDESNQELQEPFFVQWTSTNRIGKVNRKEIGVVDRDFSLGQRVRNVDGVYGTVLGSTLKVALAVLNSNYVVENVSAQDLSPLSAFVRGREILYRGWIGVITSVTRGITSKLESGPVFDVLSTESDGFMRSDPYWGPFVPYTGNRTIASYPVLQRAKFRSGVLNFLNRWFPPIRTFYKSMPVTTTNVQALGIEVKWIQKCPSGLYQNTPEREPERLIRKEKFGDVKLLGLPSSETIELNSVRMYALKPSDKILSYPAWYSEFQSRILGSNTPGYLKKSVLGQYPSVSQAFFTGYKAPARVIACETFTEVEWDDGTIEEVKSTNLMEVESIEETDRVPIGLVIQRIHNDNQYAYGIIQPSENVSQSKLVNVRWIIPFDTETVDLGVQKESLFDLKPHSKFSLYQKGTILYILDQEQEISGVGTVIDLDVSHGHLILSDPDCPSPVSAWPHLVLPVTNKCSWDFFTRKWIVEKMLPPLHQVEIEDGFNISDGKAVPIQLSPINNNSNPGTIWDEPTFEISDLLPEYHRFIKYESKIKSENWFQVVRDEIANMKESLPEGIWVRGYDTRMDLFSAVILGPEKTPYEDGLYFFDLQIPNNFPSVPPKIHHIAYASETISPFIASDGTFCVSKLNWDFNDDAGKPSSYIASALAQIQELVFVHEPFYQLPGKEKKLGTLAGEKGSRTFNEQIFLSVLSSFYNMAQRPYEIWRREIKIHLSANLPTKIDELTVLLQHLQDVAEGKAILKTEVTAAPGVLIPPMSVGFQVALAGRVEKLVRLPKEQEEPVFAVDSEVAADIANNDDAEVVAGSTEETKGEQSCPHTPVINIEFNENENKNQAPQSAK